MPVANKQVTQLAQRLQNDAQARSEFITDMKSALVKHGVDINDHATLQHFGLSDEYLKNQIQGAASSAIITIVY